MTVTLYDIPSLSGFPVSPNTWKARYCLNFKQVPYTTEWVEQPDIEAHCIKLGIEPTSKKPDGSPFYTLPAIHDSATGKFVSDSWNIAVYLDEAYPDLPTLLPKNSIALQFAFSDSYFGLNAPVVPFILPGLYPKLTKRTADLFLINVEKRFGKKLDEVAPKGDAAIAEWAKYKDNLGKVDSWYATAGTTFLQGDAPTWVDLVVAAFLMWPRVAFGEDSQQWKDIASWHDGRWKRLIDSVRKYEEIH